MPSHRLVPPVCLVLGVLFAYAAAPPSGTATGLARGFPQAPVVERPVTDIRVRLGGPDAPVTAMSLEDYVHGAIHTEVSLGELPPGAAERMAEVQSILARTYAVANRNRHAAEGFDLCATTHCQVFHMSPADDAGVERIVEEAVQRTAGLVVVHDGHVVNALFHADCGGATSAAETVWGGRNPPYLRGVDDPYCLMRQTPPWSVTVDEAEAHAALNRNPSTHVGDSLHDMEVTERDAAGRATRVRLAGERTTSVRGEMFRSVMTRTFGASAIRSTRLEIRNVGDAYVLSGTGFGHGVGVCQVGAMSQARAGRTPAEILAYYYPHTSVAPLRTIG